MKYRGYTISKSGMNYTVNKPNGERLGAEIAATIETAKKWINWDISETIISNARKASVKTNDRS